ncbi:MAG: hypothetical protein QNL87_10745 [Gammaproteobacteria bacterium]|nr:hypothetical protein [Gammaproteobacteria bacterium]
MWNETLALARDGKVDAHAGLFFNAERDRFLDYGVSLTKTDTNVFYHNSIGIPMTSVSSKLTGDADVHSPGTS